jgi:hypothetical protein
MKTIEKQLGGLVTRHLGSGNAFGEFDNFSGNDWNNAIGDGFTLDGLNNEIARLEADHRLEMTKRAELIAKRDSVQSKYNACQNIKKNKDKESCKSQYYQSYLSLENQVATAYTTTQASGDYITKMKEAYNVKLQQAKEAEDKRIAEEKAKGNIVARDPKLEGAIPKDLDKLNNPPVPPVNASAEDVKNAVVPEKNNTGRNIALIGGGLLLVVGVFLFIRSRRK